MGRLEEKKTKNKKTKETGINGKEDRRNMIGKKKEDL